MSSCITGRASAGLGLTNSKKGVLETHVPGFLGPAKIKKVGTCVTCGAKNT
jgi:hypothetical protein